ncbi:unnamed protein product, partial [marine sediment metagenome]
MSKEYVRSTLILGHLPIAGSVVLVDGFENLLKWTKKAGAGDSIFELDPTIAKIGNQSLHMKTRTTDAAENDQIGALWSGHLLPSKVLTFIFSFYYPAYLPIDNILLEMIHNDGTNDHGPQLQYNPNVPSLTYRNTTPAHIEIPDLALTFDEDCWHTIQMKVNYNTGKYISIQVDHVFVDLSGLSYYQVENPLPVHSDYNIYIQASDSPPCEINIDEIL